MCNEYCWCSLPSLLCGVSASSTIQQVMLKCLPCGCWNEDGVLRDENLLMAVDLGSVLVLW